MIVLDTNVLSELMRPLPDAKVQTWFDSQNPDQLWLASITVAEILVGIARLPDGKRKSGLTELATTLFNEEFAQRIIPFDQLAAIRYADIVAGREKSGRPISMGDAQIAAICQSRPRAALATRNHKDFIGLGLVLINPWTA